MNSPINIEENTIKSQMSTRPKRENALFYPIHASPRDQVKSNR